VARSVGRQLPILHEPTPFANSSERHFAALLDAYGIRWRHEPHSFPIEFDESGEPTGYFTPDFYLPDTDEYIELTVARQCLCTKKNRKLRLLHELYPDVKCRIIYRNDYQRLALKYGWGGEPDLPGISCVRRRPGPPDITVAE
jgi:hypothetical protein